MDHCIHGIPLVSTDVRFDSRITKVAGFWVRRYVWRCAHCAVRGAAAAAMVNSPGNSKVVAEWDWQRGRRESGAVKEKSESMGENHP